MTASADRAPSPPLRVAFLGDSLTRGNASHEPGPHGTHDPRKSYITSRGNFPLMVGALSNGRWTTANFGHGGRTVATDDDCGRSYVATPTFAAAEQWHADVAVLMIGTNDAIHDQCFQRLDKFEERLEALSRRVLRWPGRPRLFLVLPPPLLSPASVAQRLDEMVLPKVRAVAARLQSQRRRLAGWPSSVALIDTRAAFEQECRAKHDVSEAERKSLEREKLWPYPKCFRNGGLRQGNDGIHQNSLGAQVIARAVYAHLQHWCCTGSAARSSPSARCLCSRAG